MSWSRVVHYLICSVLLFGVVGGLGGNQVLAAQESSHGSFVLLPGEEEPEPVGEAVEDVFDLKCAYPVIVVESGDTLEFEVEMMWRGDERQRFDLVATSPPGWKAEIYTRYATFPEKPIPAMELEPNKFYGNMVKIIVSPLPGSLPDPGDYKVIFEASSGEISEAIDFTARVISKYAFAMLTGTLRLDTEATAGEDNHLSVLLVNSGSAPIENLTLTSTEPEGWTITYNPEKIDSFESGIIQEIDVVISPPEETIAGDYAITLRAKSERVADELELRVTVVRPTIWGWVTILIVIVAIAAAGVVFWRLGRR